MSEDKDKKGKAPKSGSVVPTDPELVDWLDRLWKRGEPPDRIELWQTFGRSRIERGEMIFHQDFKPNDRWDIERCTILANEMIAAAQNDCDCTQKSQHYQIAVIDIAKKGQPLIRRLGPLAPQRHYLEKVGQATRASLSSGDGDDEDEDFATTGKSMAFAYIKLMMGHLQWDKARYDRTMGDMMEQQSNLIEKLQSFLQASAEAQMAFLERLKVSEDHALDREERRLMMQVKRELIRDGFRVVRNLVPGLIGGGDDGGTRKPTPITTTGAYDTSGANNAPSTPPPAQYGPSPERALIDGFLNDCEEMKIFVPLFGDWTVENERMRCVSPGIFSDVQFAILVGVRDGTMPPEALFDLMHDSGKPTAIMPAQIQKAQPLMSEGVALALLELVGLVNKRRAAAQGQPAQNQ